MRVVGLCWGQGRQCGSTNNICDEEEPAYENEQDTRPEREREIGTSKRYISLSIATVTIITSITTTTTTFTKGYEVTLYSDYLRATALYAIYRNSPNLGCPKGRCEYGHSTLVFDSLHPVQILGIKDPDLKKRREY